MKNIVLSVWIISIIFQSCANDVQGPGHFLCPEGLRLEDEALGIVGLLRPAALLDGLWREPSPGSCSLAEGTLRCELGEGVELWARLDEGGLRQGIEVEAPVRVQALAWQGRVIVPDARAFLSDGFQSWSQSGLVAISARPGEQDLQAELLAFGDEECLRGGRYFSWFSSLVGGGKSLLLAGALSAERFKPWVQVYRDGAELGLRLVSGGCGEDLKLEAGESLAAESWMLALGEDEDEASLLDAYASRLPARRAQTPRPAEAGWNSWYELFSGVDAQAVLENALLARQLLVGAGLEGEELRIVVDDGWQRAWGDWQPNEKFPGGLEGLRQELAALGFKAGVWLAPLLVEADSALVAEHPDWFVADRSWRHIDHGAMRILDPTHPGAAAHLRGLIQQLVGWGYGLLKIDFLFAGCVEGSRFEDVSGMEAYARALQIIRQAAGEQTLLLAVGAPGLPSFPYVDGWRSGADIAFHGLGPDWAFVANQARSLAARSHLSRAVLCDADPPLLRRLPRNEVEAGLWLVGMSGGALFLSDDLRLLEPERWAWLPESAARLALGGQAARPEALMAQDPPERLASVIDELSGSGTQHVVPLAWRLPDGRRILWNVNEQESSDPLSGRSLPGRSCLLP